ncbi:MAG: TonB-dependent receptor [Prevotella sp.]|nr:TonB-dependent receptor [Prevotella sp.]
MKQTKRILMSLLALVACTLMYAQTGMITGTVVDDLGEGVIGATVMEKGTSNGTVTDFDGNFKLKVAAGTTLVISYIGYDKQEVAAQNGMKVTLKDNAAQLAEVVVTGYQVQRKADLTGAVAVMDMKGVKSESDPNMLNSMQGKLPGVNIVTDAAPGGGGASIRVRGMSTVNGASPLYVIDGVATTENLNSLNAADIESIQVLKDASSASIYGSRAANGVIIITTKKGKGDKVSVNVNYTASLNTIAKQYEVMDAEQWGRAYWTANQNAGLVASHPFYGSGDQPQLREYLDADGKVHAANTDWQDEVFSSAWTNNLSASVSNSSEKGSFMLSGNYINQNGLMNNTFYRRYTARLNSTYNISKVFSVGENLMIAQWTDRGYGTGDDRGIPYTAMRQHPAIPVTDANGTYTNPMVLSGSDIANPVHELYNGRDNSNESWRIFGNAYIDIKPIDGLTLKSNLGIEHTQFFNKNLGRRIQPSDMNSVSRAYGQGDTYTWTNTANYMKTFAGVHHLNALLGSEFIKYRSEDLNGANRDYAFEDVDYMQIGAGGGEQTVGGGKAEWALFSLFGKLDYNYADRYLVSATLRRDQTSRLHKDNNSGVFPAFSAAWRASEECFFPQNPVVSDLKIRAAWGQNGNSAISDNYAYYTRYAYNLRHGSYDLNGTNNSVVPGIVAASSGNRNLKWETTTQTNLGFDAQLFQGALSLSFDYFWKNTKDMLTIPPTLSVEGEGAAMWMNTGEMKNNGWELTMTYRSPQYGDFSWNGTLNLSQYKNELVKFNDVVTSQGGDYRLMVGQPMGVYYGYVSDGIFQNEDEVSNHAIQQGKGVGRLIFRDIDGNGTVDDNDRCIIGDPNPDFAMGLNLDLNYKDFTLSAFFSGEFGFDIYNTTRRQLEFMHYGGGSSTNHGVDILDAWSPTNTGATIPALTMVDNNNETRMSSYFVEDGSYLKLKYLKLGYQLPKDLAQKIYASGISVFGQVENIFTITSYKGLDPEVILGGYGARVDSGLYPRARTFTLGLNLTF